MRCSSRARGLSSFASLPASKRNRGDCDVHYNFPQDEQDSGCRRCGRRWPAGGRERSGPWRRESVRWRGCARHGDWHWCSGSCVHAAPSRVLRTSPSRVLRASRTGVLRTASSCISPSTRLHGPWLRLRVLPRRSSLAWSRPWSWAWTPPLSRAGCFKLLVRGCFGSRFFMPARGWQRSHNRGSFRTRRACP